MRTLTETLEEPTVDDGAAVWRIARDSQVLDLNSSYSYLLWFWDFSGTSVVARGANRAPVGFTTGYRSPEQPDTLVVWQIAVAADRRGHGLGAAMLDHLTARLRPRGVRYLKTTISSENSASCRLFTSFAERHRAPLEYEPLFHAELFPDAHAPEQLYRIGPLSRPTS